MNIATKHLKAPITRSQSDGSGRFQAEVFPYEIDLDNERVGNILNLPGEFPLNYSHINHPQSLRDPGARIGTVSIRRDGDVLRVDGQLDLSNKMAVAIYERMLLPSTDEMSLREFSIGFSFDREKSYKSVDGELVLADVKIFELSVVWRGAERTRLVSIKSRSETAQIDPDAELLDKLDALEFNTEPEPRDDITEQVDALIASVRAERNPVEVFEDYNRMVPPVEDLTEEDRRARDEDQAERDRAAIAQRDAEREAMMEQRDADDAEHQSGNHFRHIGPASWYATESDIEQHGEGDTFRLPLYPEEIDE